AAAAVDLFEDDRGFGQAQARAAVLFRDHRREPAGFGQCGDEGFGKALLLVDLAPVLGGELGAEGAHAFADGVVFVIQVRVHIDSSNSRVGASLLAKSGLGSRASSLLRMSVCPSLCTSERSQR